MICFTKEALEIVTPKQMERILVNTENRSRIDVSVDFSLPTGYVYVIMYGYGLQTIHGGIDANGEMST